MREVWKVLFVALVVGLAVTVAPAQPPEQSREGDSKAAPNASAAKAADLDAMISRMMAFDKNKDGKLTREEMTDPRMERIFDHADTNHDGVVTKEELVAWAKKSVAEDGGNRDGREGMGSPDGRSGGPRRGGRGMGGRGFGGFGARSQPGQILSPSLVETLKLTDQQKQAAAELQKRVDEQLGTILTAKQKQRLKDLQQSSGPGGPGGFGPGRRGRGGPPNGGPPDGGPPDGGPGGSRGPAGQGSAHDRDPAGPRGPDGPPNGGDRPRGGGDRGLGGPGAGGPGGDLAVEAAVRLGKSFHSRWPAN